tara:strand:+ start:434 stop:589 length:156 start_codon:yes stop_codon:yes gene_type:complete
MSRMWVIIKDITDEILELGFEKQVIERKRLKLNPSSENLLFPFYSYPFVKR